MVFSFELIKHANIRYRSSLGRLSRCELMAMLHALQIDCDVVEETIGGAPFLTFECRDLSPVELSWLARHSAVTLMAEKRPDGALFPLSVRRVRFLEEDCSELLKYKGKTGAVFTRMMINTAEALSDRNPLDPSPLTVADPLCGRGTALFCALEYGHHALGLDVDKKAVHEAGVYFRKYVRICIGYV